MDGFSMIQKLMDSPGKMDGFPKLMDSPGKMDGFKSGPQTHEKWWEKLMVSKVGQKVMKMV